MALNFSALLGDKRPKGGLNFDALLGGQRPPGVIRTLGGKLPGAFARGVSGFVQEQIEDPVPLKEFTKALPAGTGKVAKFIGFDLPRMIVGGLSEAGKTIQEFGLTFGQAALGKDLGEASLKAQEIVRGTPKQRELEQKLFGFQPKSFADYIEGVKTFLDESGVATETEKKLLPVLIPIALFGMELTPFGRAKKSLESAVKTIAKSVDVDEIFKVARPLLKGTDDEVRVISRELVNINDEQSVRKIFETPSKLDVPEVKTADNLPPQQAVRGVAEDIPTKVTLNEVFETPARTTPEIPLSEIPKEIQKTEQILTSIKETPTEFSLGKKAMQERNIRLNSEPVLNKLKKARLTQSESGELFDVFENPSQFSLSPSLRNKGGEEILEEARKLNRILTEEKTSREIIERAWDDDTYLKTILEQTDGNKPTAEQLARLRNATNQTFRDQLIVNQGTFSGKLRQTLKTFERKYSTADARDEVLKDFGLRTKRDFVASLEENIRITSKVTSNREFNDAIRGVARSGFYNEKGRLIRRTDIKEVYDPNKITDFKNSVKARTSKQIEQIIETAKNERILTENEAKLIRQKIYQERKDTIKTLKESQDFALDDIDNVINAFKGAIDDVSLTLRADKQALAQAKKKAIENLRTQAKKEINNFYGVIVRERGKLIDEGFKDLGNIQGAEPLRGIMVKNADYLAIQQIVNELKPSSIEDFARSMKMLQATLDLFQIPQALRSSIAINGGLKGSWDWLKAVAVATKTSSKSIIEAAEFVQLGRHKDFDIDVWNKTFKSIESEQSALMKMLKTTGEKVDAVPVLREIKDIIAKVGILEKYQWQTLMIPLKVKAWQRKVSQLKKSFPNLDDRTIKIEAGRAIDDYFGGQNWDKLMARNPRLAGQSTQRVGRVMIFALDYLTSTFRVLKRETVDATTKWGVPRGDIARKALLRKIVYGLGIANAISYALNGHSTFENEDPNQWYKIQTNIKDQKGNPYYLDILGNWAQGWNLVNRPVDALRGKISGPGRVGASFIAEGKLEITDSLNPIPFSWRNIAETIYNDAMGKEPQSQIPQTIGEGAMLTMMEFMGLAGTFSGGKSRSQTVARMIENEDFNLETAWRIITGQDVLTNPERIQKLIDKEGIKSAFEWEKDQKLLGKLSEKSFPTRESLKTKYGISGSITDDANIRKIKLMTEQERDIFLEGYSENTISQINRKIGQSRTQSKRSLEELFK